MPLQPRGQLLLAALGCLSLKAVPPGPLPSELDILHRWLDTWDGIGLIERGMSREDFDLSLTPYADEGWRARSTKGEIRIGRIVVSRSPSSIANLGGGLRRS